MKKTLPVTLSIAARDAEAFSRGLLNAAAIGRELL